MARHLQPLGRIPYGSRRGVYEHVVRERAVGQKTLAEIGESILRFDDWRNYIKGGICEYCGKMTSQPHSISGGLSVDERFKTKAEKIEHYIQLWGRDRKADIKRMVDDEWVIRDNIARTGYPDPEAKHHQHNDLSKAVDEQRSSDESFKDSWIEWVYVINAEADVIHVIRKYSCKRTWASGHVGDMRFDAVPDFAALECGVSLEYCNHYAWKHFPELRQDERYSTLGTGKYLGREKLHAGDAYGVEIDGVEYRIGGGVSGGYMGGMGSRLVPRFAQDRRHWGAGTQGVWYSTLTRPGYEGSWHAPLMRSLKNYRYSPIKYPGVKLLYPPVLPSVAEEAVA